MSPTLTAPDPAVFPADVLAFAARRGVTDYLVPLYELAKRCFDGAAVTVTQEDDCEIPGLAWVVYSVPVAEWDAARYDAAHRSWRDGFRDLCPPAAAEAFALGLR
jgi:D-arabinose 5-phosphate isomerase GutQ